MPDCIHHYNTLRLFWIDVTYLNAGNNRFSDIEQIIQHLSAQDAEILKQTHMLVHLLQHEGINPEQLLDIQNKGAIATPEVQAQG